MLNGKNLIERGVITNVPEENIQQHGIDLNVIEIEQISNQMTGCGYIPKEGKTHLASYVKVIADKGYWRLSPGMYSVKFEQGCIVPNDLMLLIRQRSSLLRNGTVLHSSVFDAGFQTQNMGTVIIVGCHIAIEVGARIAQIYGHACTPVENLYEGQWQGDKQRKDV